MGNPLKGEVSLAAGDETYTLRFSANALCLLEEALNVPVGEIGNLFTDPAKIRMSQARTLFWAALSDHQPDIDVKAAGLIMSDAGIPNAMSHMVRAFNLAFPSPEGGKNPTQPAGNAAGKSAKKATAGTG